jgi:hypothetical protein
MSRRKGLPIEYMTLGNLHAIADTDLSPSSGGRIPARLFAALQCKRLVPPPVYPRLQIT